MLVSLLAGPRLVSAPFQLPQLLLPAVFPPPSLPIGRPCGPVTFSDISFGMCLCLMSWVQQVHSAAVVARSLGCQCYTEIPTGRTLYTYISGSLRLQPHIFYIIIDHASDIYAMIFIS